jgi:hypothetical protein
VPQNYIQAQLWLRLAATNALDKDGRDLAVRNRELVGSKMPSAGMARRRSWRSNGGQSRSDKLQLAKVDVMMCCDLESMIPERGRISRHEAE